jgi:hypothetical protein
MGGCYCSQPLGLEGPFGRSHSFMLCSVCSFSFRDLGDEENFPAKCSPLGTRRCFCDRCNLRIGKDGTVAFCSCHPPRECLILHGFRVIRPVRTRSFLLVHRLVAARHGSPNHYCFLCTHPDEDVCNVTARLVLHLCRRLYFVKFKNSITTDIRPENLQLVNLPYVLKNFDRVTTDIEAGLDADAVALLHDPIVRGKLRCKKLYQWVGEKSVTCKGEPQCMLPRG